MHHLSKICLVLVSALAFCAAAGAQSDPQRPADAEAGMPEIEPGSPSEDPQWFEKLLAREAEPVAEQWIGSPDGKFRSRVAAEVVKAPEKIGDGYYVPLGVGTEAPVECWVYIEGHDLATSHQVLAAAAFESIAESLGEIDSKAILKIDAGAFGRHPFLALDWLYRVKSPKGLLAGQIKHLSAVARGGASAHCYHNEAGYKATFERVVHGLVEHLEVAEPEPDPYYEEVSVVRIGDLQAGVARLAMTVDEQGDTKIVETLSLLVPVDQQTVMANDNYNVQFSSPDGSLINQIDVESQNGELSTQLALDPADDGWRVSGTFQSKKLQGSLEPAEIPSTLGMMLDLRGFLPRAQPGAVKSFPQWMSDNPLALTDVRFQVEGRVEDGIAARLDLGPMKLDGVLDANGSVVSATMAMGPAEMEIERLYVQGTLPAP
jgi:hypothetical protein